MQCMPYWATFEIFLGIKHQPQKFYLKIYVRCSKILLCKVRTYVCTTGICQSIISLESLPLMLLDLHREVEYRRWYPRRRSLAVWHVASSATCAKESTTMYAYTFMREKKSHTISMYGYDWSMHENYRRISTVCNMLNGPITPYTLHETFPYVIKSCFVRVLAYSHCCYRPATVHLLTHVSTTW